MPPTRRVRSKNPHQETRNISNTPDQPRDEPDPGRNHSTHQGSHTRKNGRPEPPPPLVPPQRPHTKKGGQPSNLRTGNIEWTANTHWTRQTKPGKQGSDTSKKHRPGKLGTSDNRQSENAQPIHKPRPDTKKTTEHGPNIHRTPGKSNRGKNTQHDTTGSTQSKEKDHGTIHPGTQA